MYKESLFEIDCSSYTRQMSGIVELLDRIGWSYFDENGEVTYLPMGDQNRCNWITGKMTVRELKTMIEEKQAKFEKVGLVVYYKKTNVGMTLMMNDTYNITLGLDYNQKTINDQPNASTDLGWYFSNLIRKLIDEDFQFDRYKFEEYNG